MDEGACTEPELTDPVDLCLDDGSLNPAAVGWTRTPLHRCNLLRDARAWGRAKRWDYWCITDEPLIVSFTVAHVDYLALVSVWFRDLETGRYAERNVASPLGISVDLPEEVGRSDIVVDL